MNIPIGPHEEEDDPSSSAPPPPPPPPEGGLPKLPPPPPPPPPAHGIGRFGEEKLVWSEQTDPLRGNETAILGSRERLIARGGGRFGFDFADR